MDHLRQRDREPDEDGRQDPCVQDQQPGLVQWQPPQEQHGPRGGDGDSAAPARNLLFEFTRLCMWNVWICTRFYQSLPALREVNHVNSGLHLVYKG